MAELVMTTTTWQDAAAELATLITNADRGKYLIRKGSLLAAAQAITAAYARIGTAQIPTYGAKYLIVSLGFTANGSTGINLRLVGGPTVAGGFTTIFSTKEVAADDTTRSESNNVLPAVNLDMFIDFKLIGAPEFAEVQMMADVLGAAGSITRCDVYLIYED